VDAHISLISFVTIFPLWSNATDPLSLSGKNPKFAFGPV